MALKLDAAARRGDVDALYEAIGEDVNVLENIDKVPFLDTPLHITASVGHTQFSLEMIKLKPSFATKLNQIGFSAIHLALQNEHYGLVLRLVEVDRKLIRVQGRGGITPLHYAAQYGLNDLLFEFLKACPDSIEDLTVDKETVLHLAVKNNMLEAVKLLLGWLSYVDKKSIANWTDHEGNTILHLAALNGNIQMARLLIAKVDKKSKNSKDLTAIAILTSQKHPEDEGLENLIQHRSTSCVKKITSSIMRWTLRTRYRKRLRLSVEQQNAVLVVAVLVATATYQAMLSPPIDKWTDLRFEDRGYVMWFTFACLNTSAFVASVIVVFNDVPNDSNFIWALMAPGLLVCCYFVLLLALFGEGLVIIILLSSVVLFVFIGRLVSSALIRRRSREISAKVLMNDLFKYY